MKHKKLLLVIAVSIVAGGFLGGSTLAQKQEVEIVNVKKPVIKVTVRVNQSVNGK